MLIASAFRSGLNRSYALVKGMSAQASSGAGGEKKTWALEYFYVQNMLEKRTSHRPAHLEYCEPFIQNKVLIAGGAILPEVERGLLVFHSEKGVVDKFAKNDPYVLNGLVPRYTIKEWAIAVGKIL